MVTRGGAGGRGGVPGKVGMGEAVWHSRDEVRGEEVGGERVGGGDVVGTEERGESRTLVSTASSLNSSTWQCLFPVFWFVVQSAVAAGGCGCGGAGAYGPRGLWWRQPCRGGGDVYQLG